MAYNSFLIIATMETPHFSFMVAGGNFDTAKKYLVEAWAKHCGQFGAQKDVIDGDFERMKYANFEQLDAEFDITLDRMYAGKALRDHEDLRVR